MKDNLKQGLFLMNQNSIIQGAYSKPMEEILGSIEIEGKKFTSFLEHSLKEKERTTLEDYFTMVLKRSFDEQMLNEINPIAEFTYFNEFSGEKKILHTSFSTVDRGLNDIYVLGTLEDVTAARELERQLAEEESRWEEEMRTLFQVIQVDPRMFSDFIEDTEYEFDRINSTLKNKNLSTADALVEIYQSVHAIKSNAVILGLDNFGGKLHALEDTIKDLQDKTKVEFEDMLHVTLELEKLMKETDKFHDTIKKIESFQNKTGSRKQGLEILTETLSKACEKAAESMNKRVKFIVDEIEAAVLESGPRRVIKEVLTQLVRNSVYHGIETPEDREAGGKDGEGSIRLSIKQEDGRIHVKLSDDGKGLDFNKIREKALDLKLFKTKEEADDKNQLLQVIFTPGFSTAGKADVHAGRGVGLNLVRERIRDLHGSIKLSSEPGRGTVFHLFIPTDISAAKAS
jgi:two-component system chemotaxis sensor kinase CheA